MPMDNLTEYSDNYSKTSGSLWQYCKNIPTVDNNSENLTDSFNFKVKIIDQSENDGTNIVEIIVPLKYLGNFWRTLETP